MRTRNAREYPELDESLVQSAACQLAIYRHSIFILAMASNCNHV